MKKGIIALSFIPAVCMAWGEPDKQKHFAVSAAIGAAAKVSGYSNTQALIIATAPGIIKEAYDHKYGTGWSNRDMVANILGVCVGVYSTNWIVTHSRGTTTIGYQLEF